MGAFAHFQPSESLAMEWEEFLDYVDIVAEEIQKQEREAET